MSIKTELEQRDVRVTAPDASRVYTNPRKQTIINTDFGKLGASLGDSVAKSFQFISQQAEKNQAKGRELALLNPGENMTEVFRENNIPSVFSNQVERGWNIENGDIAFSQATALAKEEITAYTRENLNSTPSDISEKVTDIFAAQTKGLNPTSRAIAVGRVEQNRQAFINLGITEGAKARKEHIITSSAQKYEEVAKNGGDIKQALEESRQYWVETSKLLSAGEFDDYTRESLIGVMESPDYGADAANNMNNTIRSLYANNTPVMNNMLATSNRAVNLKLTAEEREKKRVVTERVDELFLRYVDQNIPLNQEERKELARLDGMASYNRQKNAYDQSGSTGGISSGAFLDIQTKLERKEVLWSEYFDTEEWWNLSPSQRATLNNDPWIAGHEVRSANAQAESIEMAKAVPRIRMLLDLALNPTGHKFGNEGEEGFKGFEWNKNTGNLRTGVTPTAQAEFEALNRETLSLIEAKMEQGVSLQEAISESVVEVTQPTVDRYAEEDNVEEDNNEPETSGEPSDEPSDKPLIPRVISGIDKGLYEASRNVNEAAMAAFQRIPMVLRETEEILGEPLVPAPGMWQQMIFQKAAGESLDAADYYLGTEMRNTIEHFIKTKGERAAELLNKNKAAFGEDTGQ